MMNHVRSILWKQLKDTLKNTAILIQFLMFPCMTIIMETCVDIPNMQERELTKQKSTIIGVVVPSITNMFFTELVNGIENELKSNSLSIILACTNGDEKEEQKCVSNLISRNVSGIIVAGPDTENIKDKFYDNISHKIPLVFINSEYIDSNISYV